MNIDIWNRHEITFSMDDSAVTEIEKLFGPETGRFSLAVIRNIQGLYEALVRERHANAGSLDSDGKIVVPVSIVTYAQSSNGINFEMPGIISLSPSSPFDSVAVEDPTILNLNGINYVFTTGVQMHSKADDRANGYVETNIMMATGDTLTNLEDNKVILTPQDVSKDISELEIAMVKEPELVIDSEGNIQHMIYEVGTNLGSQIAICRNVSGKPSHGYLDHRIMLSTRENMWDSDHVSTGPTIPLNNGDILMFYNGRNSPNERGFSSWAIGIVIFSKDLTRVLYRSENPVILPPNEIGPDNQLIAFANSLVVDPSSSVSKLYLTAADTRMQAVEVMLNRAQ
jgi:beta-1,2-mannobiose phosphorylase / 1,2-beta-oligomannan phosphorylase